MTTFQDAERQKAEEAAKQKAKAKVEPLTLPDKPGEHAAGALSVDKQQQITKDAQAEAAKKQAAREAEEIRVAREVAKFKKRGPGPIDRQNPTAPPEEQIKNVLLREKALKEAQER